jgi:hypothetical protein
VNPPSQPLIDIIIPVLARPERVRPLVESIQAAATVPCVVRFVANENDYEELVAICAVCPNVKPDGLLVIIGPREPGDYSRKINAGAQAGEAPWVFQGADDLAFRPGWDAAAIAAGEQTGAQVVGTLDLGNGSVTAGKHSTHSLIRRSYIDDPGAAWGEPGNVLHEGYAHQFTDNELVEVAISRGTFTMAYTAIVEHLHPFWGKARRDPTYELGLSTGHEDRAHFHDRRANWIDALVATGWR